MSSSSTRRFAAPPVWQERSAPAPANCNRQNSKPIQQVVPSIPPNAIEPFIPQPLVIEDGELNTGVEIVAMQKTACWSAPATTSTLPAFPMPPSRSGGIVRKGRPLKDPGTGKDLSL